MKKNDYVIALFNKGNGPYKGCPDSLRYKKALGIITKVSKTGKALHVDLFIKNEVVPEKIKPSKVLVNLGKNPPPGTVYGVKTSTLRETVKFDPIGEINYHCEPEDSLKKKVKKALKSAYKLNETLYSTILPIEVQVEYPMGKYAGTYKTRPGNVDLLTIKPHPYKTDELAHLLNHELGHGIWYNRISNSHKAQWVELYESLVYEDLVEPSVVSQFAADIKEYSSVAKFKRSLDADDKEALSHIVSWIQDHHLLHTEDLDILLLDGDDVSRFFPTQGVQSKDIETLISDYAGKNVQEYFAEAFAYHIMGKKIPKSARKLIKKIRPKVVAEASE